MNKNPVFLRFLLCCFVLTLLLSACGGTGSGPEAPSSEETFLFDYDGGQVCILNGGSVQNPFFYAGKTTLADAALQRLRDVGELVNGEILFIDLPGALTEAIAQRDATSTYYADLFYASNTQDMRIAAHSGAFLPIDYVSDLLDFRDHEKWGTVEILETLMVRGTLYGVSPQYWINKTAMPFYSLLYNRELVCGEYGKDDPHELYENKTWTRQALEDYVLSCTSSEGGETLIYGLSATAVHILRQAVLSNGCQMVEFDGNGNFTCGWTGPLAIEAMTWTQRFIKEHGDAVAYSFSNDWDSLDLFVQNRASFLLTSAGKIMKTIAYEVQDFGLMPWPSGPDVPYGQWAGYYESVNSVSIPIEAMASDGSAIVIDRIFEPMDEYPDMEAVMNYYTTNVFRDPLDTEILFLNRNNPLTQFCYWPDGGDDFLHSIKEIAVNASASVTASVTKNKHLLEKVIQSDIYPNRLALDNYR